METEWLRKDGHLLLTGYIYPGWLVKKALVGLIERDEIGYYYMSNEALGIYATGVTYEDALEDFKATLIDNYQRLEARVGEDPDLQMLFREYQKYLKKPAPLAV